MADQKLTDLTAQTTVEPDDLLYAVDVSDTSMAASGTSKTVTAKTLAAYVQQAVLDVGSFSWDGSASPDALGKMTYGASSTTSATNIVPVVTSIHKGMKRCVVQDNGTVNYYLSPNDSTKKADGTSATLTGADGQVMVEIPKFYVKREVDGNVTTWSIASTALSGFTVHPAFVKAGVEVDYRYVSAYDACLEFSRAISSVADAGGGDITITTSTQHPLYAGDSVTISGTTSYNGTYTVVTRASTTTFTVTATFVADETGTATGYVSGKNLDDMTDNINTTNDKLASINSHYPLVGVTRSECRTLAANRGSGWHQYDFALHSAIQLLYLVEFQSFFSQNILGAGNTAGSYLSSSTSQNDSPHTISGASNARGNNSTNAVTGVSTNAKPGTSYMSYRGIENWYGNCWTWADGINLNVTANGNVHITNNSANFADDTATGHTLVTSSAPTTSNYVSAIAAIDNYFIATSVSGGSASTFLTDYWFGSTSSNRVVLVGGGAGDGAGAGAFGVSADIASSAAKRTVGGRLAF